MQMWQSVSKLVVMMSQLRLAKAEPADDHGLAPLVPGVLAITMLIGMLLPYLVMPLMASISRWCKKRPTNIPNSKDASTQTRIPLPAPLPTLAPPPVAPATVVRRVPVPPAAIATTSTGDCYHVRGCSATMLGGIERPGVRHFMPCTKCL